MYRLLNAPVFVIACAVCILPLELGCGGTAPPGGATAGQAGKPRTYNVVMPGVYPGAKIDFPPLGNFVQGKKATGYAPGQIYVFEFFSTTCGHCAESAPVIEALVAEYTPKGFEFISITAEDEAKVQEWIAKPENAEVFKHSLALDPGSKAQKALQDPTFQILTPRFFVVQNGVVLWYGHPDIAENPFKQIAAGTWDFNSVKAEFIDNALVARAKNQISGLVKQCEKDGKWQDLLVLLESMAAGIPARASTFELQKFGTMIGPADMSAEGYAYGRELEVKYATDIASIRTLARTTLNSPQVKIRDLEWATTLAEKADQLGQGKDPRAAEIMALACFSKGDRDGAVKHQERAITLQDNAKLKKTWELQLEKYRKDEPKPVPFTPRVQPGAPAGQAAPASQEKDSGPEAAGQ